MYSFTYNDEKRQSLSSVITNFCFFLTDDTASEYYSEYDPFDYLYSGGTQYSDPVYEAVNKTDKNALSPSGPPIGWNIPSTSIAMTEPPPLPPRNLETQNQQIANEILTEESLYANHRRRNVKLYENVIIRKVYDPELVHFYRMVLDIRSKYKYDDLITNVGHVVASEFPIKRPDMSEHSSIKLLVHPTLDIVKNPVILRNDSEGTSFNSERGQIEGYAPPVVFTCDSKYSLVSTINFTFL